MKKALLLSLALLAGTASAQVSPTPMLAYIGPAGSVAPWTAASGSGAILPPPPVWLYCQATPGGPVTPCNPSSGGGGATFTPTGLQFATSTTAATVATASQVQSTIGTNPWAAAQTFTNGIVTNTATQGINTTSGIVNSFNGVSSIYAGTNATPTGSPVNSGVLQFLSSFGNGSSTNNHTWQIQDVLSGSSTAPNSTLTFTPAGTTGTQLVTMPALSVGATPSPVCTTATGCASSGAAGGDLSGTYPNPTVSGIQGNPVTSTTPTNSQSLLWQQTTKSYAPHNPVVLPTSNVWFFTDSVGQGAGASNYTTDGWNVTTGANANNGWGYLVATAIGAGVVTNKGASGSLAADVIDSQVCSGNTTKNSIVSPIYASSLSYLEEGINDARQTNSTVSARETTYLQALWAGIATLGIPSAFLTTAFSSNVTYSGSVTPTYYFQNCPGQTMQTAGETATISLTTTGNPIFEQGVTYNSDTGSYTVTIDGNPAIDSITGTTGTFSNAPFAGTFLALSPFTELVTMQRFAQYSVSGTPTNIPAGSHTIVITVVSPGTNGITFNWHASPQPQSFDYGAPTEQVWGVPYQQANADSAATAAYDTLNMTACAQAQSDGINAFCYDPRATAQTLTGQNSITIGMAGADGNTGQGVTLSDISCTSGSSQCTSAGHYFSFADVGTGGVGGKRIYVEGAGASGATLYATIGSLANFSGPNFSSHTINLVNPLTGAALTASTTVSAATAYVGELCQIYPGAGSFAGLHPNDCGHLQFARGSLGNMQPSTIAPNLVNLLTGTPTFTGNPTFSNYIQTTGLLPGITIPNPAFIHPTPTQNIIELSAASGNTDVVLQGFEGVSTISFIGSGTGMTTGTYNITASTGVAQIQCVVSSATVVGCVVTNSGSGYGTAPTFNLSVLGGTPPGLTVNLGSPLNGQSYTIKRIDTSVVNTAVIVSGGKYNGTANQTISLAFGQSVDVWYDSTNQGWWTKSGNPMTLLGDTIYGGTSGVETRLLGPTGGAGTYFLSNVPTTTTSVAETWVNAATYLASPPAIGGTAPAAGSFTTLTANGATIGLSTPIGTPTYTPGTGITSVACSSGYVCTNTRGELTITEGTATTGTIATVTFSAALSPAPGNCTVTQNGGVAVLSLGHGTPSTTSFTITAGISLVGTSTVAVDYSCAP